VTDVTGQKIRGMYITCPRNWRRNRWMIIVDDQLLHGGTLLPTPVPNLPLPDMERIVKPGKTENTDGER
jgi:hypothetical protein